MKPRRRTKIVATLGPASNSPEMLERLILAGVDVFRLNFSHEAAKHEDLAKNIREIAKRLERDVAILADLQGPKIRIAQFKEKVVQLQRGQAFCLDASLDKFAGTSERVGVDYEQLYQDVRAGDTLLLDDGRIVLLVKLIEGVAIHCEVIEGGKLSNNKGINKEGGGLSAPALTAKDKKDLELITRLNADYVAISFVRNKEDIEETRALLRELKSTAGIVTKIERKEALEVLDDLILASDAVMVARGDLGVEITDAELPAVQKRIIARSRALNRAVITATQMMESMIDSPIPTRAEVFDVANAVLDGTDAVMLSAETAVGQYPEKVVKAMSRICLGAEQQRITQISGHRVECEFQTDDEAIAMAAMYTANHLAVKAIITLTESGSTPLFMSRIRSGIPIYGLTRHETTLRKMCLFRGVYPIFFESTACTRSELNPKAIYELESRGIVSPKDRVIMTKGDFMGVHGTSNAMKIVTVGAVV